MYGSQTRLKRPVPSVVSHALHAANSHDVEQFVSCFTVDGFVDAWGMLFEGAPGVAEWATRWVVAYRVRFTDHLPLWDGRDLSIHTQVGGDGYNGPATLTFTLAGFSIRSLRVS